MLVRALSLYRAHFGAIVLTAALALVPAQLLMAGAVRYGLARFGTASIADAPTHTQEVQEKREDLRRKDLPPDQHAPRSRQLGREALEGGTVFDAQGLQSLGAAACAALVAAVLLFAGLLLAQAALAPLVLALEAGQRAGPGEAWQAVGARFGPLLWTLAVELALIALGTVFCVLPGLALAVAFAFAAPAAVMEGLAGKAALDRSLALTKTRWAPVAGMFALLLLFTVAAAASAALVPPGGWRLAVPALVRVVTYPLPLVGLALLHPRPAVRP